MRLRLKELLKEKGIKPMELAAVLWPNSNEHTRRINISGMMCGRRGMLKIEHINKICELCKCEPNDLFSDEDI